MSRHWHLPGIRGSLWLISLSLTLLTLYALGALPGMEPGEAPLGFLLDSTRVMLFMLLFLILSPTVYLLRLPGRAFISSLFLLTALFFLLVHLLGVEFLVFFALFVAFLSIYLLRTFIARTMHSQ